LKSNNKGATTKIQSVLVDSAYDSNRNIKYIEENNIQLESRLEGIQSFSFQRILRKETKKLDLKQKISIDRRVKENMDIGGYSGLHFHL
jgi:hypothetical protein